MYTGGAVVAILLLIIIVAVIGKVRKNKNKHITEVVELKPVDNLKNPFKEI